MNPLCTHLNIIADGNRWICTTCSTSFEPSRFAKLTPWSLVAELVEERNTLGAENVRLRKHVEELLALGVSIHKNSALVRDHIKGNVNHRLTRAASDAHDRGDSALADALAKLAIEIEENE